MFCSWEARHLLTLHLFCGTQVSFTWVAHSSSFCPCPTNHRGLIISKAGQSKEVWLYSPQSSNQTRLRCILCGSQPHWMKWELLLSEHTHNRTISLPRTNIFRKEVQFKQSFLSVNQRFSLHLVCSACYHFKVPLFLNLLRDDSLCVVQNATEPSLHMTVIPLFFSCF